jgi:hypothetical protein
MFDDYRGNITQRRLQRTFQKYFLLETTLDLCQTSNNKKCNYINSNIVSFEYEVYVLGLQKKKAPCILPTIRFYHYLVLWFCNFMFCCMNVSQMVIKQGSLITSHQAIFICFRSLMIFSVRGRALCCFSRKDLGRYLYLNLPYRARYT